MPRLILLFTYLQDGMIKDSKLKAKNSTMLIWRGINLTMTVFFFLAAYVNVSYISSLLRVAMTG